MSNVRHVRAAAALLAVGAALGLAAGAQAQAPAAPAAATNLIEHSFEHRFQLDLRVPDAALQKMLPAGWEPNIATQGPAKDTNVRLIFIDRYDVTGADGRPKGKGMNRLAHFAVPIKQTSGNATGQMIVGGISEDPADATAPAGVYLQSNLSKMQRTFTAAGGAMTAEENWELTAASGERLEMHIKYQVVPANRNPNPADTRFFSVSDPSKFVLVRSDQGLDIMQNVPVPVPGNRVTEFTLKAGGGKFATLFDGTEKVMSWDAIPWAVRTISNPPAQ
jgi:hypothetical protein